jgi:hypothetical protein
VYLSLHDVVGMFVRIGVHWWDVWNQNCIDLWFQSENIHHVHACCPSLNHFQHRSNHKLYNRRIIKKIVSFHVWYFVSKSRVFPFWNFPYLGCVDRCYVFTRDIFFWNKRVIPFWNFPFLGCNDISCYLLQLFIHVQYVANITAS